jgi:hypothetical protein
MKKSRSTTSRRQKLALIAGSVAFTFIFFGLAAEVLIRVTGNEVPISQNPVKQEKILFDLSLGNAFGEHPFLPFSLLPGRYDIGEGKAITINRLGYRGREFPPVASPGTSRVLFVGDSYVYGMGVDDAETLPVQLESRLRRKAPGVEVINAGFHGSSPAQYDLYLRTEGFLLRPKLLLVSLMTDNDVSDIHGFKVKEYGPDGTPAVIKDDWINHEGRRYYSRGTMLAKLPVLQHSHAWLKFLRLINLAQAGLLQEKITEEEAMTLFERSVLSIANEAKKRGVPVVFVLMPGGNTLMHAGPKEAIYLYMRTFLEKWQFDYVDLGPAVFSRSTEQMILRFRNEFGEYTEAHFNGQAYGWLADAIAEKLGGKLKGLAGK